MDLSFLHEFTYEWKKTIINNKSFWWENIKQFINEFWTSKQRQSNSIHEVSYRACFKAELPRFFIEKFTKEWDIVYDPFSWRWTTAIEAWLLNRNFIVNDINPLTKIFTYPRYFIPSDKDIEEKLASINIENTKSDIDLSMFYEKKTLSEILSLRKKILDNPQDLTLQWIRMVATTRLTWHSPWYFSVYTLPPNQAVSIERQKIINQNRSQIPGYRDTKKIILKKSKSLKKNLDQELIERLKKIWEKGVFLQKNAWDTPEIKDNSVSLVVTSPPFMDVIDYAWDNRLRCWFNWYDSKEIGKSIIVAKTLNVWCDFMERVFKELFRITKRWWSIAFEVWEIKQGKINLDEYVISIWVWVWFKCQWVLINTQEFTKTANIRWVSNNNKWTNTNRIVLFSKL